MVRFSIQGAHEQVNPTDLLNDVIIMDKYGIERCWTSDHHMPWWDTGASGGAAWPWLGAAWPKLAYLNRYRCNCSHTKIPSSHRGSSVCYTWIYVS